MKRVAALWKQTETQRQANVGRDRKDRKEATGYNQCTVWEGALTACKLLIRR